jgi:hypothetical protein
MFRSIWSQLASGAKGGVPPEPIQRRLEPRRVTHLRVSNRCVRGGAAVTPASAAVPACSYLLNVASNPYALAGAMPEVGPHTTRSELVPTLINLRTVEISALRRLRFRRDDLSWSSRVVSGAIEHVVNRGPRPSE